MYLGRAFSWIKSLHSSAELIVKFPTATRNVITEVLVSSTVYRINTNTQCLEKACHYISDYNLNENCPCNYNKYWYTYYSYYMSSNDGFIFPPYLHSTTVLPWETFKNHEL